MAVTTTKSSGRRALRVRPCGEAVVLDDQGPTSACFSAAVGRHPSLHDAAEIIFFAFVLPYLSRYDATCRTTATAQNRSSLAGLARSASGRKCTLTAPICSASRANTGTKGSSQAGGPALSIGALAGASEDQMRASRHLGDRRLWGRDSNWRHWPTAAGGEEGRGTCVGWRLRCRMEQGIRAASRASRHHAGDPPASCDETKGRAISATYSCRRSMAP